MRTNALASVLLALGLLAVGFAVSTTPATASPIFSEDFEGNLNAWTVNDGSHCYIDTSQHYTGASSLYIAATNGAYGISQSVSGVSYPFTASIYFRPNGNFYEGYAGYRSTLLSVAGCNNFQLYEPTNYAFTIINYPDTTPICTITYNEWHHLEYTLTGDNQCSDLTVDGVSYGPQTVSCTLSNPTTIGISADYPKFGTWYDDAEITGASTPPATWAPTFLNDPQTQGVHLGGSYSYVASLNETCNYSMDDKPDWADLTAHTVAGMPDAAGLFNFSMRATSVAGLLPAWKNWTVHVTDQAPLLNNTTWGPTFMTTPDTTVVENLTYSYSPGLNESGDLALMVYPAWATVDLGTITGVPNATGFFDFHLRGHSDSGDGYTWQNWSVEVLGTLPGTNGTDDQNDTNGTVTNWLDAVGPYYGYIAAGGAVLLAIVAAWTRSPWAVLIFVILVIVALYGLGYLQTIFDELEGLA